MQSSDERRYCSIKSCFGYLKIIIHFCILLSESYHYSQSIISFTGESKRLKYKILASTHAVPSNLWYVIIIYQKNRNCTYLFLIAFCKLQHWLHWCNLQRHLLVRYNIIRCSILSYEKESYIRTCIHTKIFSELHHRWIFHHKTFWMTINYVYTHICLCKYDKARYRLSFERKMSLLFIYINSY